MRKPIVAGNWKMNTAADSAVALAGAVSDGVRAGDLASRCEVAVFPPFVYLLTVRDALLARGSAVLLGAQDVYPGPNGAFTGEVSCAMLKDCGVRIVLTGHSERRHGIGESDDLVNRKTRSVLDSGLSCVLCIGELLSEREAGRTDAVNERQVRSGLAGVEREHLTTGRLTIAYEPVWAIGTGRSATAADAQHAHAMVRRVLATLYDATAADAVRILYGGSCNAANAPEMMPKPDIDGGLIGGASLKADEFLSIVRSAAAVC